MSVQDGGPAFPHGFVDHGRTQTAPSLGMSLRDYFAGQALALGGEAFHGVDRRAETLDEHVAIIAYEIADAMLEARKR